MNGLEVLRPFLLAENRLESSAAQFVGGSGNRDAIKTEGEQEKSGQGFSPDILEFLRLLERRDVRYLIAGGEAVIYYGHPQFTGDIEHLS